MLYMGIHELWFILLVVRIVEDSLHLLILILFHLLVEHKGGELFIFDY